MLPAVISRRFCYDARGNQTHRYVGSSLTRRVDYTIFDKPHTIWSNQGESRFSYDAAQKLVKRIDKKAGGDTVTYYVVTLTILLQHMDKTPLSF
ncbi:hypothetical protein [Arsukibacterium sp.]|uniref:hypothetical protein n=1 Tax=Arsukibacterium sp. TaxID=1977258 RepID=UPI002FD9FCF7